MRAHRAGDPQSRGKQWHDNHSDEQAARDEWIERQHALAYAEPLTAAAKPDSARC